MEDTHFLSLIMHWWQSFNILFFSTQSDSSCITFQWNGQKGHDFWAEEGCAIIAVVRGVVFYGGVAAYEHKMEKLENYVDTGFTTVYNLKFFIAGDFVTSLAWWTPSGIFLHIHTLKEYIFWYNQEWHAADCGVRGTWMLLLGYNSIP